MFHRIQRKGYFHMDVIARINEIMKQQGLTEYKLAKLSNLSPSTIKNIKARNTVPSITTLESICDTFNMTLSQFFADKDTTFYPLNPRQAQCMDLILMLNEEQQQTLIEFIRSMKMPKDKK